MTRIMFDLHAIVNSGYTYTNVAGGTVENHTAKPNISIERDIFRTPVSANANGDIRFTKAIPASSEEFGPTRNKRWLIIGYILHKNVSIFDDATIMSMKAEIESVLNVHNTAINGTSFIFSSSDGYNEDPVNAMYDFIIEAVQYGVTTLT